MSDELSKNKIAKMGRQLERERWELPQKFRLTQEMLKKSDEEQSRLAALSDAPFSGMSPQEVGRVRAVQIAKHLSQTLDRLNHQVGLAVIKGEGNVEELRSAQLALRHQLAERYAEYGRYDLAMETEPETAHRQYYADVLEAIWRDDDEWCHCEPNRGSGEHANIQTPKQYIKHEIFNMKTGSVGFLLACSGCQMLNVVSEMPSSLRQQRAHRAKARQLVSGMSMEDAERTLKNKGLTSAKLLK